ncbi:hypothetical protein AMK33_14145 [Streptomyces sp. CB02400]|nr:hypothetical protein AMK33_14145 [Streptomyces sp. CB02400]
MLCHGVRSSGLDIPRACRALSRFFPVSPSRSVLVGSPSWVSLVAIAEALVPFTASSTMRRTTGASSSSGTSWTIDRPSRDTRSVVKPYGAMPDTCEPALRRVSFVAVT